MEKVSKMGGSGGVSEPTQKLISALADSVEQEHGVVNGKTALYWNLLHVVQQHAKDIDTAPKDGQPSKPA